MASRKALEKFKDLVKRYWYIGVPIHAGTSALWYGSCFGAVKMGLDFVPLIEKTGLPEKYVEPLKKGNLGNFAQAFVVYKIITPFRYASSIAIITSTIKTLKKRGVIK